MKTSHPTDEYIHWTERHPKDLAAKLRPAYDLIVQHGPEYNQALEILLAAAYAKGRDDEIDANSEDL